VPRRKVYQLWKNVLQVAVVLLLLLHHHDAGVLWCPSHWSSCKQQRYFLHTGVIFTGKKVT
jgi:hypothetical protein